MEDTYLSTYFKSKCKTNQLRTILKEEGFKRLKTFWTHPFSEVYSKGELKAKIIPNEIVEDYGYLEYGPRPHKYKKIGIEFNKEEIDKTLSKKIRNWYMNR